MLDESFPTSLEVGIGVGCCIVRPTLQRMKKDFVGGPLVCGKLSPGNMLARLAGFLN